MELYLTKRSVLVKVFVFLGDVILYLILHSAGSGLRLVAQC